MVEPARWPCASWVGAAREVPPPATLAAELAAELGPEPGTLIAFVCPDLPVSDLMDSLQDALPEVRIYGASASGVVGDGRIGAVGISLIKIPAAEAEVRAMSFTLPRQQVMWNDVAARLNEFERALGLHRLVQPAREGAALLFSAGLLETEEYVASRLHLALPDLPLVGGSASDGLRFEHTFVIEDGEVLAETNLVLLCRFHRPFNVFQHHHFRPTERHFVVTEVGESARQVVALDGLPAAEVYRRALGLEPGSELEIPRISKQPFGVRIQDRWYIRSVYRVDGEALTFASGVEVGSVLMLMEAGDLVASLERWREEQGELTGAILFNCLGRFLEMESDGLVDAVTERLRGLPVAGMNTYGEQYMGLHLNHTLTGISFRAES